MIVESKIRMGLFLLVLCCSVRPARSSTTDIGHELCAEIIPGKSVGPIRLGDDNARVVEALTEFPTIYQQVQYPFCGKIKMVEWFDKALAQSGLAIYLRNDKVFQIESETTRFRTADGIAEQSLPEDVKRQYPDLEAYELLNSAGNLTGGKNLIYWVDRNKGIAFSFYYNIQHQRRLVARVIVFEPETDFEPNGCVTAPQKLRKLRPYSLEPPGNSA
jgi:hypothetical protein